MSVVAGGYQTLPRYQDVSEVAGGYQTLPRYQDVSVVAGGYQTLPRYQDVSEVAGGYQTLPRYQDVSEVAGGGYPGLQGDTLNIADGPVLYCQGGCTFTPITRFEKKNTSCSGSTLFSTLLARVYKFSYLMILGM